MVYVIQTALELGFMYALVAMALFLSYRILDIADLTTDSGFFLGAAVSVTVAAAGHPFLAILAAMAAGSCAGFVTAFLQTGCSVYPGRNRYKHRSLYGEPDGHGMELQCQSLKAEYIVYHDERDRDWRRMV